MADLSPSYSSLFNEHKSGISYIDFLPGGVKEGYFNKPTYDRFEQVVNCANEWLKLNPQWQVNTCESIEFKDKDGAIYPTKMSYIESTNRCHIRYFRGLRLWLRIFPSGEEKVQKIGYVNLVPDVVSEGGVFTHSKYETVDDVLLRFNNSSRMSPLPGRIITIETQNMKIKRDETIDPNRSHWSEYTDHNNRFIYVIRIFYEVGDPLYEEIGMKDFIPGVVSAGLLYPRYEDFQTLFNAASQWCASQSSVRICNMQTLSTKLQGNELNTRKMSYTEHEGRDHGTRFVKTLRVAHIRRKTGDYTSPIQFSCKSFAPVQTGPTSFFSTVPPLETLQQTMRRVSDWIQATGAEVLNMETTTARLSRKGTEYSGNKTFYYDKGRRECYIFIIRAYLKGSYKEPV